jgi:hypothetical protein
LKKITENWASKSKNWKKQFVGQKPHWLKRESSSKKKLNKRRKLSRFKYSNCKKLLALCWKGLSPHEENQFIH